jgi:hypothetical protein
MESWTRAQNQHTCARRPFSACVLRPARRQTYVEVGRGQTKNNKPHIQGAHRRRYFPHLCSGLFGEPEHVELDRVQPENKTSLISRTRIRWQTNRNSGPTEVTYSRVRGGGSYGYRVPELDSRRIPNFSKIFNISTQEFNNWNSNNSRRNQHSDDPIRRKCAQTSQKSQPPHLGKYIHRGTVDGTREAERRRVDTHSDGQPSNRASGRRIHSWRMNDRV